MKKIMFSLVAVALFSSFTFTPEQLTGTWRWIKLVHAENGSETSVTEMTMGMASGVRTTFNSDKTYTEAKTASRDGTVSKTEGTWSLDEAGTTLTQTRKQRATAGKIIHYANDTLIVEMKYPMQLFMVREK